MFINYHILLIIIISIFCTPPPQPGRELLPLFIKGTFYKEGKPVEPNLRKPLADNAEYEEYIPKDNVIINFEETQNTEEHKLTLEMVNLVEEDYYDSYYMHYLKPKKGLSLKNVEHSCYINEETKNDCQSSLIENDNDFYFIFNNFKVYNGETLTLKYKFSMAPAKIDLYYRQEQIFFPRGISVPGTICNYTFIISKDYKSLGLKNNIFKKESDNIYSYYGNCPTEKLSEIIKFSPIKSFWSVDWEFYVESKVPIKSDIRLKFLRMYKGGKSRNKNYKLTTYENKILNDSALIKDEIYVETDIPGNNNKKIGVKLHTSFINDLNNEFILPTSNNFYELNTNIDEPIKAKVNEVLQDPQYKDYPDYEKIGRFVHNYINYNDYDFGKNYTPIEIFNQRTGVCEHFTELYNTMLNYIGIKTIKIIGYAFEGEETTANENTAGHAWTGAFINGKWKELDATWDLFEGISGAHILRGFNIETYYARSILELNFFRIINIKKIDNLDSEVEDKTYIESYLAYNGKAPSNNSNSEPTNNVKPSNKDEPQNEEKESEPQNEEEESDDIVKIKPINEGNTLKSLFFCYIIFILILL